MKKLEADLVNLSSVPSEKKSNKKFIEEKDKLIESFEKKLKGYVSNHPQTEEIMVIQERNEDLNKENMELNAKLLQLTKEKEDLASKSVVEVSASTSHQIDTVELTKSLAQVSLKEKEISHLVQEKNQLEKSNKEKRDKINRLKHRLLGKEVLKSTQHSLWDLVSIEVKIFWKEMRRMDVKKAYIYSSLDKHTLATKQLAHFHKTPTEKAQIVINFLTFPLVKHYRPLK